MNQILIPGADASIPGAPFPYPTHDDPRLILAAYVGAKDLPGPPDTPHIWTPGEWNEYIPVHGPFGGRKPSENFRLLPLYVHSFPGDPVDDARNMVDAVTDLGWTPDVGRLIALDIETLVDPIYVAGVWSEVKRLGFRMLVYGSLHYLQQNPACDGRFPALLTKYQPRQLPAGCVAQQWKFGPQWDSDVFSEYVWENAGRGFREVRN